MALLVQTACKTLTAIRSLALDILSAYGIKWPVDFADGVENITRDIFVLVDEPEELLIDLEVMFLEYTQRGVIHGDCDDAAMFAASLLYSVGLPIRFKAIQKAEDGSFQHVYVEYFLRYPGRWVPLDSTIQGIPIYAEGDCITLEV